MHALRIHVDPQLRAPHAPSRDQLRELGRRGRRAALRMGVSSEALPDIGLRICDDEVISRLKLEFFGVRQVTDVLSFPSGDADGRGDIALSWPTVQRQAAAQGVEVMREATVLMVHAFAHLLGHDHIEAWQGIVMHRLERAGLAAVRVPDLRRSYGQYSERA